MAFRVSFPLFLSLLLLLSSLIPPALSYTSKKLQPKVGGGGSEPIPIPNCGEMGSRTECEKRSKWCRWCRSETLDDMCFGSSEAWRLPHQETGRIGFKMGLDVLEDFLKFEHRVQLSLR